MGSAIAVKHASLGESNSCRLYLHTNCPKWRGLKRSHKPLAESSVTLKAHERKRPSACSSYLSLCSGTKRTSIVYSTGVPWQDRNLYAAHAQDCLLSSTRLRYGEPHTSWQVKPAAANRKNQRSHRTRTSAQTWLIRRKMAVLPLAPDRQKRWWLALPRQGRLGSPRHRITGTTR